MSVVEDPVGFTTCVPRLDDPSDPILMHKNPHNMNKIYAKYSCRTTSHVLLEGSRNLFPNFCRTLYVTMPPKISSSPVTTFGKQLKDERKLGISRF